MEDMDWSGTTGTPSRARRRGELMEDFITAADLGLKDPPVFESPPCIHGGGQRVFKDRRVVYSQSPLDQTQVLGIDVLDQSVFFCMRLFLGLGPRLLGRVTGRE